jgi:hypothetical protein
MESAPDFTRSGKVLEVGAGFSLVPKFSSKGTIAFSSEVDTGSREENASKQQSRASLLI